MPTSTRMTSSALFIAAQPYQQSCHVQLARLPPMRPTGIVPPAADASPTLRRPLRDIDRSTTMRFDDRVIVLTGVAREGQVGEAVARAFAERGAIVALLDREAEALSARAAALVAG